MAFSRAQVLSRLGALTTQPTSTGFFAPANFSGTGVLSGVNGVAFTRVVDSPTQTSGFRCDCGRIHVFGNDGTTPTFQAPAAALCGTTVPCTCANGPVTPTLSTSNASVNTALWGP